MSKNKTTIFHANFSRAFSTCNCAVQYIIIRKQFLQTLVTQNITKIGATMNRLESAFDAATIKIENLVSSLSTIRDADIAKETTDYLKSRILKQAGSQLLGMHNEVRRSSALALLQGVR